MRLTPASFSSKTWIEEQIDQAEKGGGELWQWESLLRYHFKVDPDSLTDADFFNLCAQLRYVIKSEQKRFSITDG